MYLYQTAAAPSTKGQRGYGFTHYPNPSIGYVKPEDFHVLSASEKKAIFAENNPRHVQASETGKSILARVQQLAPEIGTRFAVKSDPVDNLTMRLWCPSRELGDSIKTYFCLSYCRSFDNPTHLFGAREMTLPLSSLMAHAFASLRTSPDEGLWIDELCIDQRNTEEKAIAISAMDTVYRCAEGVFVALQDVEVHAAQQAFLRSQVAKYGNFWWLDDNYQFKHMTDKPPFLEKFPVMKRFVYTILGSRYFTRAWCSHELQMRNHYVFCMPCQPRNDGESPTEVFQFGSNFLLFLICVASRVPCRPVDVGSETMDYTKVSRNGTLKEKLFTALQAHSTETRSASRSSTTSELLSHSSSYPARIQEVFSLGAGGDPLLATPLRQSSIIIDKTTIVLNVLGNGLRTTRKVEEPITEAETLKELYVLGLAANDPLALCTMGPYIRFTPQGQLSWLRRPTYSDLGSGYDRKAELPPMLSQLTQSIFIDPSADKRWITLDVFALGLPRPPSERYLIVAKHLVDKCVSLGMGKSADEMVELLKREYNTDYGLAEKLEKLRNSGDKLMDHLMSHTMNSMNSWGAGPQYQYWYSQTFSGLMRQRFVWTVAIILHCGRTWILETAQKCGYPAVAQVKAKLEAYFGISNTWDMEELESSLWYDTESGRSAVDAILWLANWVVVWGCDMAHGRNAEYMPAIYEHGRGGLGYAVVFTRGDALLQLVIPCMLLPDSYSRLFRVWLVEAKDDPFYEKRMRGAPMEWFLRAKAILFTNVRDVDTEVSAGSAGDGKPGWRFRPGVQVHGPPEFVNEEVQKHLKSDRFVKIDEANLAMSDSATLISEQVEAISESSIPTTNKPNINPNSSKPTGVVQKSNSSQAPSTKTSEELDQKLASLNLDNTASSLPNQEKSDTSTTSQKSTNQPIAPLTQSIESPVQHQMKSAELQQPHQKPTPPTSTGNNKEDEDEDDMAWASKAWKKNKWPTPKK